MGIKKVSRKKQVSDEDGKTVEIIRVDYSDKKSREILKFTFADKKVSSQERLIDTDGSLVCRKKYRLNDGTVYTCDSKYLGSNSLKDQLKKVIDASK